MRLKELLKGIDAQIYGKITHQDVFGLSRDSRCIKVGDIFVAHKGSHVNGNDFAKSAIQNGAVAVLSSLYNPFLPVVQIISNQLAVTEAKLAAKLYGDPSSKLTVFGVTGTNGKTTVTHLIKKLLDASERPSGMIGTIKNVLGKHHIHSHFTTPTASLLQKYFSEMVKNHLQAVAMEVSSIGIALQRVEQTHFDVGILTNITQDHLDFHDTMSEYIAAKLSFFASLPSSGLAVINQDIDYAEEFLASTQARCVTYGFDERSLYRADNIHLTAKNSCFDLHFENQVIPCAFPLIGRHNVHNVLAALAAVHQYIGGDLHALVSNLSSCTAPRGRLELIQGASFPIYIDYAHTPDALNHVCRTLKELLAENGKLITVFGCGGDRDRTKRSLMARASEQYGFSVVTSDNPRGEDPEQIIQDICSGFMTSNFAIQIDRKQAIAYALSLASDNDIVLIAGKGHETYQIFKHNTITFNDKEVVDEWLSQCV